MNSLRFKFDNLNHLKMLISLILLTILRIISNLKIDYKGFYQGFDTNEFAKYDYNNFIS